MTAQNAQFKEVVRDQWSHAADAWRTWHPKFSEMSREVTEMICDAAQLRPGMSVLDLAGGTGEPGISVAAAVAPGGNVVCTDFIPAMVATAEANARAAGVANMKFQQVDAEDIPFPDDSFDRVVARFGLMFFPNIQQALGEIRRVMKPDGRAAFTVWQSITKNGWFNDINALMLQRGLVTAPPSGTPSPFRFGEPGSVSKELTSAGFTNVEEVPKHISWSWPGAPDEYIGFIQGTFPAWQRGLNAAPEDVRESVKAEMLEIVRNYYDGARINFGGDIFLVTAAA